MRIEQFLVGNMQNFTYIMIDEENQSAIVIDPSWDLDTITNFMKENSLKNRFIINTHSHFDHVVGNDFVSKDTGAKVMQHTSSPLPKDVELHDGDLIPFGKFTIKVVHTPGHSKDSICLVVDNEFIITGDTIFVGSCGRLDLPGGSAEEMYDSIYGKLINMKGELKVLPGHHYGSSKTSTLQKEIDTNIVFKFKDKDEFVAFMNR
ncbi:MAG: MBL fold metallo-hydrolase [Candidatus Nitrosocosmicus sp.]